MYRTNNEPEKLSVLSVGIVYAIAQSVPCMKTQINPNWLVPVHHIDKMIRLPAHSSQEELKKNKKTKSSLHCALREHNFWAEEGGREEIQATVTYSTVPCTQST